MTDKSGTADNMVSIITISWWALLLRWDKVNVVGGAVLLVLLLSKRKA